MHIPSEQVKQIESLVGKIQHNRSQKTSIGVSEYSRHLRQSRPLKKSSSVDESTNAFPPTPPLPMTPTDPTTQSMLTKLLQQNEELKSLLKQHHGRRSPSTHTFNDEPLSLPPPELSNQPSDKSPTSTNRTPCISSNLHQSDTTVCAPTAKPDSVVTLEKRKLPKQTDWSAFPELQEVEWTEEDEQLLEKLKTDPTIDDETFMPGQQAPHSKKILTDVNSHDVIDEKHQLQLAQKQKERADNAKRLAKLFQSNERTGIRRPRWRIEADSEANGSVTPFNDDQLEDPMPAKQIFRAAGLAVVAVVMMKRMLRQTKLEHRAKSIRDFDAVVAIYFDATRVWLGKLVKVPLTSIVQDSTLDLDVSSKGFLSSSSTGITGKFGSLFLRRRASPSSTANTSSTTLSTTNSKEGTSVSSHKVNDKVVKLKVRVKAIVDAFVKAIEKRDIPGGILDFWRRLTSDGVYLPPNYTLFPCERVAFAFDEFDALQELHSAVERSVQSEPIDGGKPITGTRALRSKDHHPVQVMLVNFIFLRVLIPHVILQPWTCGITSSTLPQKTTGNLKNVATLMYAIAATLSPLPAIIDTGRRQSAVDVVIIKGDKSNRNTTNAEYDDDDIQGPSEPGDTGNSDITEQKSPFFTLDHIHSTLITDKTFPVHNEHIREFVDQQGQRLCGAFASLRKHLHPPPSPPRTSTPSARPDEPTLP